MSILLSIFSLLAKADQSSDSDGLWLSLVAIAAIYAPFIFYNFIKGASEDHDRKDTFTHSSSATSQGNTKQAEKLESAPFGHLFY